MEAMKVMTKVERKPINKVELNDRSIEKLKVADFDFTYIAKDGSIKTRDRITIPLKADKKTSLKGLKLTIHRSTGSKIFMVNYKFQGKSKFLVLGKFSLGIFGIKQVEELLFPIVKDHTNESGHWIKDPQITRRNETRVITKENVKELERKTINEVITEFYKSDFPRATRPGNLRARSMKDHSLYLIGHNWRVKHMSFVDVRGSATLKLTPNWHKRTARPESIEDLFKRYPPGTGLIKNEYKAKSIYDSPIGKTYIDELEREDIEDYLAIKSSYGVRKGIIASIKIIWFFAKSKRWTVRGKTDPTSKVVNKRSAESKSKGSIHNEGIFDQDETHRILGACDQIKEQYPFQAESLKFMCLTGQRKEQILKLKTNDIDMVNKIIIFPATITKKGKKEELAITPERAEVLIELGKQREKHGEKFKFIPWLFPSVKCNKKRLIEPGYQQSDYTRIKDNKHAWEAVKKIANVGGARKLFRKTWSTEAKKQLGDEAISVTGHDQLATLDRFYNKSKRAKMISDSEKVSSFYQYKKLQK